MKTIEDALNTAYDECKSNAYFGNGFKKGVEYATNWNKINIADIKTFPDENEPVLVKDGDWLFVGVRNKCIFVTDVESVELTNDIEWRLINFK